MVYEAAGRALREFIRLAAKHRLAFLFDINSGLACESADHAKLLRRHVTDGVLPVGNDAIKNVCDRVPLDILDHVEVSLAVSPALAGFDDCGINLLLECAQRVGES